MAEQKISEASEFFHIYNRGVNKQNIFFDRRDWSRFLFYILYYQSPRIIHNSGDIVNRFIKTGSFNIHHDTQQKILKNRHVELVSFAIMPNHFHLLVGQKEEGGITNYLMRIQDGYTKYINIRHDRNGHLFQGRYKSVRIESNKQLLYLSSYIHKNPKGIRKWKDKWATYPLSSFQDYSKNRWGEFLQRSIILDQFKNVSEYQRFVKESTAKQLNHEILIDLD